jgi:16S rRNA (guanine966-N2)-methyltransferase
MRSNTKHPSKSAQPLPQLRIIGGQWRSRKLSFAEVEGLRPTPDRVRETLFNWMQNTVAGAKCLDLFAGSGALGIEALSRGAENCTFVDISPASCSTLKTNLTLLNCNQGAVLQRDALQWLAQYPEGVEGAGSFDLVFLDPPFRKGHCQALCDQLAKKKLLAPKAYIYIETEHDAQIITPWRLHREKRSGQVHYRLYQVA